MADTVRTRHRISGQIDENTPRHIAEHEVLGKYLEIVADDVKPYVPELYKPEVEDPSRDNDPVIDEPDVAPKKNGKV